MNHIMHTTRENLLVNDRIQLLECCIVNNGMKLSLLKQKLWNFKRLEIAINRVKNLNLKKTVFKILDN